MAQINGRKKGHAFELYVRDIFRRLGYVHCKTSRSCNRELDAAGVDLVNAGRYLVQCKAVEQSMDVHALLERMPKHPRHSVRLVAHKRNRKGITISMPLESFVELVEVYERAKRCPICSNEPE